MSTLHERVWNWLRRRERTNADEVRRAFRVSRFAASRALRKLLKKGCAKRSGGGRYTWYVATKVKPDDLRGTAEGTLRTLARKHVRTRRVKVRVELPMLERLWTGVR